MKAIVLNRSTEHNIILTDVQPDVPKTGEVKVAIKAAALNHRDEWSRKGLYPNLKDGIILGSDGAGVIAEVGEGVSKTLIGKEVIINPASKWGDNPNAQSNEFEILGMPKNGTLAEYVTVPLDRIHDKPSHLSWEEAAALPLAGLTAFRAITFRGKLQAGENLLVTGFGGGVAQFAAQFGLALGANVAVSSSSPDKLKKGEDIGVKYTFNYTADNWVEEAVAQTGGFDLIIDGAAGDPLNQLIDASKAGGRIVFYGATLGDPAHLIARKIFWKQLNIMGSTMGTDEDFEKMISFVSTHQIQPIVDQVFNFTNAVAAFDRLKKGEQMGKIVLTP